MLGVEVAGLAVSCKGSIPPQLLLRRLTGARPGWMDGSSSKYAIWGMCFGAPLGCAGTKEHRHGHDEHHTTVNSYIGNRIGTHPGLSTTCGEASLAPAAAPAKQVLS